MQTEKHDAHYWAYRKVQNDAYRADFEYEQYLSSPEYQDAFEAAVQAAAYPEHY